MSVVVACHQPNFLPWLGYFAKIARADAFVLLDDVQFTQGNNRHNWTTRVRVMGTNGPMWLSIPVLRTGRGRQIISSLVADAPERWLPQMLRTLDASYRKAPFADEVLPTVLDRLSACAGDICATNIACIRLIAGMLDLKARLVCSSSLPVDAQSTDRLVDLTRSLSGTAYLTGDGAGGYQDERVFGAAGIELCRLNFCPVPYPQRRSSEFVPGLSIVDALCNVGIEQTRALLNQRLLHDGQ